MGRRRPPLLFRQVDSDLAHPRPSHEVVVAHQTVEINGGVDPGEGDHAVHLRDRGEVTPKILQGRLGYLQGAVVGQVRDHQKIVFVVKGEHLQGDQAHHRQEHRDYQQPRHPQEKEAAQTAVIEERRHGAVVDPVYPGLLQDKGLFLFAVVALEEVIGGPGRHGEGDGQAHEHGQGHVQGHGRHVGAHHAGDEVQGDKADDYREGGQDGGSPDLVHRHQGGLQGRMLPELEVAVDVLHVDDGVIHQQAQGQDQGKEGHPVDGVAEHHVAGEGDGQGQGHRQGYDEGLPPPQEQRQEHGDGEHRDEEFPHELVDLLIGGGAVVPGHFYPDGGRDDLWL